MAFFILICCIIINPVKWITNILNNYKF